MILYQVLWDNGECYEDHDWSVWTFSTLEKAEAFYNKEQYASPYHTSERLILSSFDEDDERQTPTKIAERILPCNPQEAYYDYCMEDSYYQEENYL